MKWFEALLESSKNKKSILEPQQQVWSLAYSSRYESDYFQLIKSSALESREKSQSLVVEIKRITDLMKTGKFDDHNRPHKIIISKGALKNYTTVESDVWDLHLLSPKSKYVLLVAKYSKQHKYVLLAIGEEAFINKSM